MKQRWSMALIGMALIGALVSAAPVLAVDPVDQSLPAGHQHGDDEGHLLGTGAQGKIELVDVVEIPNIEPEFIADVAVDPSGDFAYLVNWGFPDCTASFAEGPDPETGGVHSPDAGVYVIDITGIDSDPDFEPSLVGFIPTPQDTRPGEGAQVAEITTQFFSGEILAFNHEGCGQNAKGGFSLWDVSDPSNPVRLATGFGDRTIDGSRQFVSDANQTHSVFIWDAGDRAYLVAQDEHEASDVDIFDITNPRRPVLIAEYDLNQYGQPALWLTDTMLHDMIVKEIDGRFYMLLSYWDAGWIILDVTDPANAIFIGQTDYDALDPVLLELGIELPPEGNAHQAEFTLDNEFIIGTDEDFDSFKLFATIDGVARPLTTGIGVNAAGDTQTVPVLEPGDSITGPVYFLGQACDPAVIPAAPVEDAIAVIERGACDFQVKLVNAEAAGYDAAVIFNTSNTASSQPICEGLLNMIVAADTVEIPSYFVARSVGYALLGIDGYNPANCPGGTNPALPAVGPTGDTVTLSSAFDGWGYVHLIDNNPDSSTYLQSVDQFAIPEAHDPAFATGFGDLSVHEVAVDPQDPTLAYLSYYAGGLRAVQIQCTDPTVNSTCELVEVGSYLDPEGNNFWGVETFIGDDGFTYILASDRDSGLWIFRDP